MNKKHREPTESTKENLDKFNFIYNKYHKFIYRTCKRHVKLHRDEDAEDLTNDTLLKIWENLEKFDLDHPHLKNYIMRTAMFTAMVNVKLIKNLIYYNINDDNLFLDTMIVDDSGDINHLIDIIFNDLGEIDVNYFCKTSITEYNEDEKILLQKLQNILTEDEYKVLYLRYFEFYDFQEVIKISGFKKYQVAKLQLQYKCKIIENREIFEKYINTKNNMLLRTLNGEVNNRNKCYRALKNK